MLRQHPEWRRPVAAISDLVAKAAGRRVLHPTVLAALVGLSVPETIAYLHVLEQAGEGRLRFRVVDDNGLEIGQYDKLGEVPDEVEDEFGRRIEVTPENTEYVFVGA